MTVIKLADQMEEKDEIPDDIPVRKSQRKNKGTACSLRGLCDVKMSLGVLKKQK